MVSSTIISSIVTVATLASRDFGGKTTDSGSVLIALHMFSKLLENNNQYYMILINK